MSRNADNGRSYEKSQPCYFAEMNAQFAESAKFEKAIKANLKGLSYGV